MCCQHDAPPRRLRMVAAHPVEGDVVVVVATGSAKASAASPDSTTTQPTPAAANWSRSAPLNNICWTARARSTLAGDRSTADRQVAGRQHVGPDPPRQRVEHRCIARPLEAPHAVHGKDGDRAWVGVDHRRDRRPSRRIFHRGHLAAHSPRQIGKRGDQRRAADQRRRDRRKSLSQCDDGGSACERVAGNRQRHPFLAIAQHAEAGQRANRRLQRRQTGTGRHRRGHHHRDRSQDTAAARPPDGESPRAAREPRWRAVPPSQRPRKALSESSVRRQRSRSHRDLPGCRVFPGRAQPAPRTPPPPRPVRMPTTSPRPRPTATAAPPPTRRPWPPQRTATVAIPRQVRAHTPPRSSRPTSARSASTRPARSRTPTSPHRSPAGFGLAQPHHRRGHPRQAAVADEQAPVPLQQALGDVRIPDRDRHRHALPGQPGLGQNRRRQPCARPTPRATARPSTAP